MDYLEDYIEIEIATGHIPGTILKDD